MRNFKRFLAVALAMLMVCSAMISVSAKSFPDVAKDDDYAVAIDVLSDLKIVLGGSDGKYNADATLTRWQMAVFASKLLSGKVDYDWTAGANETPFVDITDAYGMCAAAINYAYTKGLIKGTDATHYAPNDTITVQDAMTLLVRLLGYDSADMVYPNDFISLAAKLGLEDGLFFTNYKKAITRGEMAQMVYNTLFARRMSVVNPYIGTIAEDVFGLAYGYAILAMTPSYILDSSDDVLAEAREHGDLVGFYVDDEIAIYTVEQLQAAMGTDADVDTLFGQTFTLVANANDNYKLYTAKASGADIFTEDDAKFEILTDKDNNATGKVKIDGTTYKVVTAYSNHNHAGNNYVTDNEIVILNANEGGSYPVMTKDTVYAAALSSSAPKYYDLVAIDADADGKYDYAFLRTYEYGVFSVKTSTASTPVTTYTFGDLTITRKLTAGDDAVTYAGNIKGLTTDGAYIIADYDAYYDTLTVRKTLEVQGPGYISHAGQKTITIDGKAYTIGTTGLKGADATTIKNKLYTSSNNDTNAMIWAVGQSLEFVADGDALYEIIDAKVKANSIPFVFAGFAEDVIAGYTSDADYANGVPVYIYKRMNGVTTNELIYITGWYENSAFVEYAGTKAGFNALKNKLAVLEKGDQLYTKYTVGGDYFYIKHEDHNGTATNHYDNMGHNFSGGKTWNIKTTAPAAINIDSAGHIKFSNSKGTSDAGQVFRTLYAIAQSSIVVYSADHDAFFVHNGPLTDISFTGVTYVYTYGAGYDATINNAMKFDYMFIYLGQGGKISNIANFAQFTTVYVGDNKQIEVYDNNTFVYTDVYDIETGKKIEAGVASQDSYIKKVYNLEPVTVNKNSFYLVDANGYIVGAAAGTAFSSIYTNVSIVEWDPYQEDLQSAVATIKNGEEVIAQNVLFDNIKAYVITKDGIEFDNNGNIKDRVTKFRVYDNAEESYTRGGGSTGKDANQNPLYSKCYKEQRSGGQTVLSFKLIYDQSTAFNSTKVATSSTSGLDLYNGIIDAFDADKDGSTTDYIVNPYITTTYYVSGSTIIAIVTMPDTVVSLDPALSLK